MSELDDLYRALEAADAAGETSDARELAGYIQQLESQQPTLDKAQIAADQEDAQEALINDMGVTERTLVGVGRGMTNVGRGVQDAWFRMTDDDDSLADLNKTIKGEESSWKALSDESTAASIGEIGGEIAATLPLGGLAGIGGKAAIGKGFGALAKLNGSTKLNSAGRIAGNFGEAAIDGAIASGITQRGGLDERMDAATGGAALGAAGAGVLGVAGKVGNKFFNKGKEFTSETARVADGIGEQYGVPIHLEDAIEGGDSLSKMSGWFNEVPVVGTNKGKKIQNAASERVAKEQIDGITGYSSLQDAESTLQTSIRESLDSTRAKKNDLYDNYHDSLAQFGSIPRTNTNALLDDLIASEKAAGSLDKGFLKELNTLRKAPEGDINILMKQRKSMGDKAKSGFAGQNIGTEQSIVLGDIRAAMNDDAAEFAGKLGKDINDEIMEMKNLADDFYKASYVPFKENKVLQAGIKNNEPEVIIRALNATEGSVGRTKQVYNAMNRQGQQRMQSAFLLDAFKHSFQNEVFSPKAFRTKMNKMSKVTGVLFSGEDKKFFDGLMNLLEHTKKSAESVNAPMNGSRMMIMGTLGIGTSLAGGGAGGILAIGGASTLFKLATQTKTMRQLITGSAKRSAHTKKMDFAVDYLGDAMRRAGASASVDNE